jgi:DNA repair protein RadC
MSKQQSSFRLQDYRGYELELLVRRRHRQYEPYQVECSRDIYNFMRPLSYESSEFLYQVNFDNKHRITGVYLVAKGDCAGAPADEKEVFKSALITNSPAFALIHNHPSSVVDPSRQDHTFTHKIYEGAELLGLRFLDSIIVGDRHYFSFCDEGLLKK